MDKLFLHFSATRLKNKTKMEQFELEFVFDLLFIKDFPVANMSPLTKEIA